MSIDKIYCRKCQKTKASGNFYGSSSMLDSNGFMSICKDCCGEIYNNYFGIFGNLEEAIYKTCQLLDVCFNYDAISATKSHMEKLMDGGKKAVAVFGYYKSKLSSTVKQNSGEEHVGFNQSDTFECEDKQDKESESDIQIDEKLKIFWGYGFANRDYIFLETEFANWKKTHKCDNQSEITLLKEICIKILEIRRNRENNSGASKEIKDLQELMKTASVDPAKANIASAGKSLDAYGVWIKDIEQFRPAEWYEKQEKYVDMDGFKKYISDYIVRPIKNFLTGDRDFQIDEDISINTEEEYEGDE